MNASTPLSARDKIRNLEREAHHHLRRCCLKCSSVCDPSCSQKARRCVTGATMSDQIIAMSVECERQSLTPLSGHKKIFFWYPDSFLGGGGKQAEPDSD